MSKRSFIDSVEVKTPCSESWDEMIGTNRIRFCSHCAKHVNNISEMTRKEAARFVRASGGNICIRYIADPTTRRPLFADGLIQIARRTPRLTAGVMAASLTVATVRAQEAKPDVTPSPSPIDTITLAASPELPAIAAEATPSPTQVGSGGRVSGTVTDPNGAVVPGTSVTITSEDGRIGFKGTTNENGVYNALGIPAGVYTLTFVAQGFKTSHVIHVGVYDGQEPRVDVNLDVAVPEFALGGVIGSIEYRTPLAQAVADDDLDKVRDLLAHGENVNGKDENYDNITPLFIAVENGSVEMVKLLLGFGAKVNARNKDKQTPLMYLDRDATPELVEVLLRAGAKVNAVDKDGNSPLIRAAADCDPEIVKALLDAGADVKAVNGEGRTALLEAANSDIIEKVRSLIAAGAEVNAKDKEGKNAWDLTSDHDIELLLMASGTVAHPKLDDNGALAQADATPSPTPPIH
ncbi:MAG: ankyrin repeat domain-containing protein [Acidobacteria bacterium]|nr:ankyrin repeat domain-containing protein [Acidobacteriota bacterium]